MKAAGKNKHEELVAIVEQPARGDGFAHLVENHFNAGLRAGIAGDLVAV